MKQLGKSIVVVLCFAATLLILVGLKRKFDQNPDTPLLSQSADAPTAVAAYAQQSHATRQQQTSQRSTRKPTHRPRVVQAAPPARQESNVVSPTISRYEPTQEPTPASRATSGNNVPENTVPTDDVKPIDMSAGESISSGASPEPTLAARPGANDPTTGIGSNNAADASASQESSETQEATQPMPRPEFVLTSEEDSFWSISEQVYGSGIYYRALFRHNEAKVLRPDQLRAGIRVVTPPLEQLRELYVEDFPDETSGDS